MLDLLKETGKLACKPVEMPIEQNHLTTEASEDEAVDKGCTRGTLEGSFISPIQGQILLT
ncbi:hypothetical protein CK203_117606 [Vitis vinifera]|uniref:Uncharacterized protein n=2 Tax=Vitis vinifera TaxID=29760 RepID=A0A438CPT0_VITVI|nr:hypothetical protein CK203_117606 [Vitis vinifera]